MTGAPKGTSTDLPVRLVLLGPPGAGKGTQAVRLAERLGVPAISTGDIFRVNAAQGTELGRDAQRYMDAGEYVPDDVTNAMVADRLRADDTAHGFLLDGYPRTSAQVQRLDEVLGEVAPLQVALEITADTDEVVARLLKRAAEQGRSDDTEDVVRHRLDVYSEQTAPLVGTYAARGLLVSVDGLGAVDEVTERVLSALSAHGA